jgi:hypothetical protein
MFTESSPLLRCDPPALSRFKLARSPFIEDKHEIRKCYGLLQEWTIELLRYFSGHLRLEDKWLRGKINLWSLRDNSCGICMNTSVASM